MLLEKETEKVNANAFEKLRCPDPDCRQVLFEIEKSFLTDAPDQTQCSKCSAQTFLLLYSYNETEPGKLIVRHRCSSCKDESDRRIPSIRKYCKGCKKYQQIFLTMFGFSQFGVSSAESVSV